jgi:YidC/Oxa1 family membrane protein insertase
MAGLLLVLAVFLIAGSAGAAPKKPAAPTALSTNELQTLSKQMAAIEGMADAQLLQYQPPAEDNRPMEGPKADFLVAYSKEVKAARNLPFGEKSAYEYYLNVANGKNLYSPEAWYRIGVLNIGLAEQAEQHGDNATANSYYGNAAYDFTMLSRLSKTPILVRLPAQAPVSPAGVAHYVDTYPNANALDTSILFAATPPTGGPVFFANDAASVAMQLENYVYKNPHSKQHTYYAAVDAFVGFFRNHVSQTYGAAIALIILALLIKIVTAPLTTASYRGMRDMQRIQPLIKELQEKYKDDKAKIAEEQMKIMKDHKVNPLGGCLPMLIQLPIFIVVYTAVRYYAWQFSHSPFLWVSSLAKPDWPLLILYALSMIVTQKLTTPPSADPQQKAMQTQMTYLMPVMLLFILGTLPSAFVLYWFFLNVFSAAHQYYLVKRFDALEAAAAAEKAAAKPAALPEKPAATESGRKAKRGKR